MYHNKDKENIRKAELQVDVNLPERRMITAYDNDEPRSTCTDVSIEAVGVSGITQEKMVM